MSVMVASSNLLLGSDLHHFLRDLHIVVVLLADDVDLVIGRLPHPAGRHLVEEFGEHPAVIDLRRIDLEIVPVLVAIFLGEGEQIEIGVAGQQRRLVVAQRLEHRLAGQRHEGAADGVGLRVDDRAVSRQNAVRREDVAVVVFDLDLPALHAASSVDLVHGQRGAAQVIGVVGDLGGDHGEAQRLAVSRQRRCDKGRGQRRDDRGAEALDDGATTGRPILVLHRIFLLGLLRP